MQDGGDPAISVIYLYWSQLDDNKGDCMAYVRSLKLGLQNYPWANNLLLYCFLTPRNISLIRRITSRLCGWNRSFAGSVVSSGFVGSGCSVRYDWCHIKMYNARICRSDSGNSSACPYRFFGHYAACPRPYLRFCSFWDRQKKQPLTCHSGLEHRRSKWDPIFGRQKCGFRRLRKPNLPLCVELWCYARYPVFASEG